MVVSYTGLNYYQVEEMDIDEYLFFVREAYIHGLNQTEDGRKYLENCWRMTQTKPDRAALRDKFGKGANYGK